MRVRKKPVEVEAHQLDSFSNAPDWVTQAVSRGDVRYLDDGCIFVRTHHGSGDQAILIASTEDYLIRGVQGELYPCTSSVFHATYDILPEGK